jgi:tripartite-type tricarboxylate transporter receptor subunit TctC
LRKPPGCEWLLTIFARELPRSELFKNITGIEMTHIPYKGSAPAVTDVVAGPLPIHFSDPVASLPLIREGKLRALGVTTGMRMPSAPDIPPIGETGVPGFEAASWIMIAAPANTPKEIVARLHEELKSIAQARDVSQQLVSLGMIPVSGPSPEALQRFVSSEIAHWARAVHQAGIAASE